MVIKDQEIAQLFLKLRSYDFIQFNFEDNHIKIKALENGSSLSLSTPIYLGSNYIPKSVRLSIQQLPPFGKQLIPTFIQVDEAHFSISLNYLGKLKGMNLFDFKQLLEEFVDTAEQWRVYLDDQDNNDRVYIYQKR